MKIEVAKEEFRDKGLEKYYPPERIKLIKRAIGNPQKRRILAIFREVLNRLQSDSQYLKRFFSDLPLGVHRLNDLLLPRPKIIQELNGKGTLKLKQIVPPKPYIDFNQLENIKDDRMKSRLWADFLRLSRQFSLNQEAEILFIKKSHDIGILRSVPLERLRIHKMYELNDSGIELSSHHIATNDEDKYYELLLEVDSVELEEVSEFDEIEIKDVATKAESNTVVDEIAQASELSPTIIKYVHDGKGRGSIGKGSRKMFVSIPRHLDPTTFWKKYSKSLTKIHNDFYEIQFKGSPKRRPHTIDIIRSELEKHRGKNLSLNNLYYLVSTDLKANHGITLKEKSLQRKYKPIFKEFH